MNAFPGSAVIDATGRYRYTLRRQWGAWKRDCTVGVLGADAASVLWIMLNPSTADAVTDDATIRRCVAFSKGWGFAGLTVVNLFALRATDPRSLRLGPDFNQSEHVGVIGPENDEVIEREAGAAQLIVAAWGNHGALYNRAEEVLELIGRERLHHLGLTKMGQPRHPLYLRHDVQPQPWKPR